MALKGDLSTFELPDLLSLIATSRRNGMLVVKRGNEEKSLCFSDGLLIFASSTTERERLGEVLVRERLLESDNVIKARKIQATTGKRLGTILVAHNFVTPDKLVLALKAQAQEIITSLFQWWGGDFEFVEGDYPYPTTVAVGFNMQALIMEATKTVDDWARIKRILPDLALFAAINNSLAGDVQSVFLQRQEWEMLSLVNGQRHIQDICSLSPYSDLETCEVLARLVSRGLLMLKNTEDEVWENNKIAAERSLFLPFIRMMNEVYYVVYEVIMFPGLDANILMNESIDELAGKHPSVLQGIAFLRGILDVELVLSGFMMVEDDLRLTELTETLYSLLLYILKRLRNFDEQLFLLAARNLKVVVRLLIRRQGSLLDTLHFRTQFEKLLSLEE